MLLIKEDSDTLRASVAFGDCRLDCLLAGGKPKQRALAGLGCVCDPKCPASKCLPGPSLFTLKACPIRTGPPCRTLRVANAP